MKYSDSFLCCAAFTGLLSVTILSAAGSSTGGRALAKAPQAAPQQAQPTGPVVLPDGPGKDTAKRVCSGCHSADVWAKQRHTSDQWGAIVNRMVSKGAEGTDDDFAQILQYLNTNFAPIPTAGDVHPGTMPPSKP